MTGKYTHSAIAPDDNVAIEEHVGDLLNMLKAFSPKEIQSMAVCVVTKEGPIKIGILGSPHEVVKMLADLVMVARHDHPALDPIPDPTSKVVH